MTNKTTEALKLAEEALGRSQLYIDEYHPEWVQVRQENEGALAAIRAARQSELASEALAEPESVEQDYYHGYIAGKWDERLRAVNVLKELRRKVGDKHYLFDHAATIVAMGDQPLEEDTGKNK